MKRFALAASLLALAATSPGCASTPADLDLTARHPTAHAAFTAELEPPAMPAAINQMHAWEVRLTDRTGRPVTHARIDVDGGMPQHGHGLPTQPRVTRELEPGLYLIEGMKFSMTGWWEIRLKIDAGGITDTVTFNTIVGRTTAVR